MKQHFFARQLNDGLWQWRMASSSESEPDQLVWQAACSVGDHEALLQSVEDKNVPVTLVLQGQEIIGRRLTVDASSKKYLDKLLPFELEDDLPEGIEDLHLVHDGLDGIDKVELLYVDDEVVSEALQDLKPLNDAIYDCLPDYLLVERSAKDAVVIYEDNLVIVRCGKGRGFTVEAELAPLLLSALADDESEYDMDELENVHIVATDEEALEELYQTLPEKLKNAEHLNIERHIGGFWDWVATQQKVHPFNLRSGKFARRLPFERWWKFWKPSALGLAAAFLLACLVTFADYFVAKQQRLSDLAEIDRVYNEAVPGGRKGDPEGVLRSLVRGLGGKAQPSNLMPMLSRFASSVKKNSDLKLTNFRYNGDQRELVLSLEADSFATLESLRARVSSSGFSAELLRVSAQGDVQQARMKVTEAASE